MTPRRALVCAGMVALATLPRAALAWGTLILLEAPPAQDTLAVGASHWSTPRSPDGRHQTYALTPAIDYERHDGWFVSTETGAGFNVSRDASWQAGARLWPQLGLARQDQTDAQPRLGPRLQKQLFANAMLGDVALAQSAVSYGSGRSQNGVQTELGLTSGIPLHDGMIGIGVAATYGNRAYRRDYAGIDACGWSDWSWTVNLDHKLGKGWHADAQWQNATLINQPAPSSAHPHALLISLWRDL
ncbi:MAG: hypothetical protein QM749_11060 [Aquabacterium sp.]